MQDRVPGHTRGSELLQPSMSACGCLWPGAVPESDHGATETITETARSFRHSPPTASKTLSGKVVAGSFRKGGFSSTKPIPCRGVFCGPNGRFQWCGLALHFDKRPVLTLVADEKYPQLFRIRYPDGWTSTPANITRAKDAAYGHARFLLTLEEVQRPDTLDRKGRGQSTRPNHRGEGWLSQKQSAHGNRSNKRPSAGKAS